MHYALYKLHIAESGAPGIDGIMAWMLLWANDTVMNALIPLFTAIWRWGVIPNCWKLPASVCFEIVTLFALG